MNKPGKKDASFILKAIIVALVVMAGLHAIPSGSGPETDQSAQRTAEASYNPVEPEIVPLRAGDVSPLLKNADGKTTMVFVYASWCPYCKQMMPGIMKMANKGELNHLNLVFLSLDTKFPALKNYLVNNNYQGAFTPYLIKRNAANPLSKMLVNTGSSFEGNVPYVAFFSAEGKLLAQIEGMPRRVELQSRIASFKH